MDLRFFLLPMPFMMVFTLALAHTLLMVPNGILIHAVVRLVGVSALSQQIFNCAQEHMDQSHLTMLLCQWLSSLQSSSWSKGLLLTAKYVYAGFNKLAQRTICGAHVTLWTRLQQALSKHKGTVESSWCTAHATAENFHQFAMTPEILFGIAVADALAKNGASVFPAVDDWGKMDQITWAVQQRTKATSILAALAAPRNASAPPRGHFDRCTPNPKTRAPHPGERRTHCKGITATCANILLQGVEFWIGFGMRIPSAQDRPALIRARRPSDAS